jgi:hypothetical protein
LDIPPNRAKDEEKLNKISGRRIALAHSLTTSSKPGILNMFSVIALAARHGRLCFMCHIPPLMLLFCNFVARQ